MSHAIGEALYELVHGDWDGNGLPDWVNTWPVIKVTSRYVYVHGARHCDRDRTYRLDRAILEKEGRAWHRGERVHLYVRPQVDWPLMVIDVNNGQRALAS